MSRKASSETAADPPLNLFREKETMRPGAALTLIDLFSGCGGVTAGFKAEGFRALAAVDRDPVAARTYHLNHPEVALRVEDIRSVSPETMMEQCGLQGGQLTVLSVCAPCQPFSRQNRRRSGDDRALLVLEAVRFAHALRPAFLFMENVPGLGQDSDILNSLLGGLEALGYRISPRRSWTPSAMASPSSADALCCWAHA